MISLNKVSEIKNQITFTDTRGIIRAKIEFERLATGAVIITKISGEDTRTEVDAAKVLARELKNRYQGAEILMRQEAIDGNRMVATRLFEDGLAGKSREMALIEHD